MNDRMLKIPEVAKMLGVSSTTVRRWVQSKQIPAYRLGRQWRAKESDVLAWMEARKNTNHDAKRVQV